MENKKIICFGEVLWDNLPDGPRIGGAPLNVCYHLNKNGMNSKVISQVGQDDVGKRLLSALDDIAVDRSLVLETAKFKTSTVEVLVETDGKVSYEIVDPVAWDDIPFKQSIADEIAGAEAFIFGTLALRHHSTTETLFRYLDFAKCIVLDINLRKPFYSKELILQILERCHILKINDEELELLGEWLHVGTQDQQTILKEILNSYINISEILLTKGAEGASYCNRSVYLEFPAVKIQVKDTVGSGDSFLAAFLASRFTGTPIAACMQKAILLSAFVASQSGACPPYNTSILADFRRKNGID